MNTHLATYVEHKLIAEWAAERIDQEIDNEDRKQQVADAFIERQSDILDEVLGKSKNPQGKILYQAPAKTDAAMSGAPRTKVQTVLRLIKENDWLKFSLLAAVVSLGSAPGLYLFHGISASAMWAYSKVASHEQRVAGNTLPVEDQTAVNVNVGQREQRLTGGAAKGSLLKKDVHLSPPVTLTDSPVNRPSRQPPSAASQNLAPKPSFLSSLAHGLAENSDGLLTSAIPMAPVVQGVVAVKDAAVAAHDEAPAVSVPPGVVNLRGERAGHTVRMTWDSPGTEVHYNVYVAYATNHPVFDTGNDTPLNGPVITWTPPSEGTQVFELYLKAVDVQGHEGPASNHIIADLR